jgi:hypothetical protein
MANGKRQMAKVLLQMVTVGLMYLLMVGALQAGEPFAVLELFTSQG